MYKGSGSIPVCLILHANLQYAEIPTSEITSIVEKSYLPTLDLFLNNKKAKMIIDFSGVTLEIFKERFPEVIEKIRQLLIKGNVEILGSTYANPILPLIPLEHAKRQIVTFEKIFNELFGDLKIKPRGLFPQEYFIDAATVTLLCELGYKWVPIHGIQLINSLKGNLNNAFKIPLNNTDIANDYQLYRDIVYPIRVKGACNSETVGFGTFDKFTIERLHELHEGIISWDEYLNHLYELVSIDKKDCPFVFLGPSDLEFVGHFSFEGHKPISPNWLVDFCEKISKTPKLIFCTPSEYLSKHEVNSSIYLKNSGDHVTLDPWTKDPDNSRLNTLCEDASLRISQVEDQLGILVKMGYDISLAIKLLDEAWKLLMLAENADGRGWNPIPERRLFCYTNAVLALRKAEEALEVTTGSIRPKYPFALKEKI